MTRRPSKKITRGWSRSNTLTRSVTWSVGGGDSVDDDDHAEGDGDDIEGGVGDVEGDVGDVEGGIQGDVGGNIEGGIVGNVEDDVVGDVGGDVGGDGSAVISAVMPEEVISKEVLPVLPKR